MLPKRLLCIGNAAMELRLNVPHLPGEGDEIRFRGGSDFCPSGKGVALAVACARAGADAVICSRIGNDYHGNILTEFLKENAVDVRFLVPVSGRTEMRMILREGSRPSRRMFFEGTDAALSPDDIEEAFLCVPDAVLLSSELSSSLLRFALGMAQEKEIPVFYYAGEKDRETPPGKVHLYCAGADTAERLTGTRPLSQGSCMQCAVRLAEKMSAAYVLLELPGGGYFLYDGKYADMMEGFDAGAGTRSGEKEAFLAFLAAFITEKRDRKAALRAAMAAAAITRSKKGYVEAIPSLEEVENFLNKGEAR